MGLRVDGTAIIKKKYHGTYYTLAQEELFEGTYNRHSNQNLLPHNEWISLRAETMTAGDSVVLRLFLKREGEERWTRVLEAVDDGSFGVTPPIREPGRLGLRTDFMDVEFDSFQVERLTSP